MKYLTGFLLLAAASVHAYKVDCHDHRNKWDVQCIEKAAAEGQSKKEAPSPSSKPIRTIKHAPGQPDQIVEHSDDGADSTAAGVSAGGMQSVVDTDCRDNAVAQAVDRLTNTVIALYALSLITSIVTVVIVSN